MPLDRSSYVPLYLQLAEKLSAQIHDGTLRPGMQLPSERELAEDLSVSRVTARQALDKLVEQGIIYRVQGRGTFVAEHKIREVNGLDSFTADMRRQGLTPRSEVLVQSIVPVPAAAAEKMNLATDTRMLYLERIRLANDQPLAHEKAYINYALCPGLEEHDLSTQSLYAVLRDSYNVFPTWAEAEIEARAAKAAEAALLDIEKNPVVIVAFRLTYSDSFEPIEYVESVYRGDRFSFYIGRQRILPPSLTERR